MFDDPRDADQAHGLSPDEVTRLAYPELTRCDYCGRRKGTHRYQIAFNERRWLHSDCAPLFKPPECHVVHLSGGIYRAEDDLYEHSNLDEDEEDDGGEEKGWKRRQRKTAKRIVGAVVLLDGVWHGYRHNNSGHLKVPYESESREDVIDAFSQHVPYSTAGQITHLISHGVVREVETVQWCGGWVKCDCYGTGEIQPCGNLLSHRFRWEDPRIVRRRIKVLP